MMTKAFVEMHSSENLSGGAEGKRENERGASGSAG